jgi:SAM-dependent methyltransferase
MLDGLVDTVFACAPGRWALARCETCGAAWLDPRPTRSSIMRAYARYYTHVAAASEGSRGVQRALRQGYLRARWGYELAPAWPFGGALLSRRRRAALDLSVRHLARPKGEARLLDVGCGNGAFLSRMRALGWRVHGLEPDPAAAKAARALGIDVVVGTLADTAWPDGSFDAVTMSSVIEHLHDPGGSLAVCRRLLAPGGTLHIMTPNADALGVARFGSHWRGLETPRHLVLFNPRALSLLLDRCGFEAVTFHPHFVGEWFWLASGAIAEGLAPDDTDRLPRAMADALRREGRAADRRAAREPGCAEELVVTARKPAGGG